MYPIINIFGKKIGTYALLAIIGLIVSGTVASAKAKKHGKYIEDMFVYYLTAALGIIIGGHLLYGIVNINLTADAFIKIYHGDNLKSIFHALSLAFGGSVFYGGLFGSVLFLRLKLKNKDTCEKEMVFDIYSLCIPLFHTFGRIGCFFGGCCYGIESKFGFIAKDNPLSPALCGVRRFPVALLEAAVNLLIFFLLLMMYNSGKFKNLIFRIYGLLYPFARFFIEFLRGDSERGVFLSLSVSQWISVVFFAYSLISLIVLIKKKRTST